MAALELLASQGDRVRLVLTDVAMAEIGGRELGRRLAQAAGPDLPVLYMSGYPEDEVVRRGLLEEHRLFIQKPFTPSSWSRPSAACSTRPPRRALRSSGSPPWP